MKIRNIWSAALLACIMAVSCTTDRYEPGQEDTGNCPDVYFDGGQSGQFAFDQTENIELVFTVSRVNTEGSFVVPLEITGQDGIIDVTPLMFLDGEESAEITVRVIAPVEIQKKYEFILSIPSPEFAPIYGLNETSLTFSVIREDYVRKNTGTFHSELLGETVSGVTMEYSEILDLYRIVSPWRSEGNITFHWDGKDGISFEEGSSFYIAQITDSYSGTLYSAYAQPEEAEYDPDSRTFTFTFWYAIPAEGEGAGFGYSEDTFKLD